MRWSFSDKGYWLSALSGAPLAYVLGPYFMAGYFGAVHAVEVSRWLGRRGERQRLGLHSDGPHRCSQLALPRNKKLRNAILDEFSRRFTGNCGPVRPTRSRSRHKIPIRLQASKRQTSRSPG